jgi:hypothetical protein
MGGFWPRIYVVKKGHARDIDFLLQTRGVWHFSAIYSPAPFIAHRLCWLSHIRLRAPIRSFCRSNISMGFAFALLVWYRTPGWGRVLTYFVLIYSYRY